MNNWIAPIPAEAAAGAGREHRAGNLIGIIGRIEQVVEEETAGIRRGRDFDIDASNARKSRYLYELSRAAQGMEQADLHAEAREGLLRLREKLSANEKAIRAHLGAVTEIAALIRDAMQQHEADGTYSALDFTAGANPGQPVAGR